MSSNSVKIFFPECGKKGVQTHEKFRDIRKRDVFKKGNTVTFKPQQQPKFC